MIYKYWKSILLTGCLLVSSNTGMSALQGQGMENRQTQQSKIRSALWNNRANNFLAQAEKDTANIDTAIVYYQKAAALDSADGGIKLNLALAYLVKGDTTAADSFFHLAYTQLDSSEEKMFDIMGIDFDAETSEAEKGTPVYITQNEIEKRVKKSKKKPKKSKGGVRPTGKKNLPPEEIKKYLYKKQVIRGSGNSERLRM